MKRLAVAGFKTKLTTISGFIAMAALALSVSGCSSTDTLEALPDGPFAPGVDPKASGGDTGIEVGHRLMAAREYELALKAYYRTANAEGMRPEIRASIGSANLGLARLDQAEAQLRQAVEEEDTLVSAWNNLGVVLMEKGEVGEASRVFRTAFALDAGNSPEIRENLRMALANMNTSPYTESTNNEDFKLVPQDGGQFLLLSPS